MEANKKIFEEGRPIKEIDETKKADEVKECKIGSFNETFYFNRGK